MGLASAVPCIEVIPMPHATPIVFVVDDGGLRRLDWLLYSQVKRCVP
jgi:hypothetical protein